MTEGVPESSPEYVYSGCHRPLFKKSKTAATNFIREKIKKPSEDTPGEKRQKIKIIFLFKLLI